MSNQDEKLTTRDKLLMKKYGINEAQWNKLFDLQGGKCPICLKPIFKPGNKEGRRSAAVDHNHRGNKRVRGLLHYFCNRFVIGKNTAEKAKRVADYLCSDFDARQL